MRLGFDYLLATTHGPGLGRYARELVRALGAMDPGIELALWEWGAMRRSIPVEALGLPSKRWKHRSFPLPGRLQPILARIGFTPHRILGPLDLFHRVQSGRPTLGQLPYSMPLVEPPVRGSSEWGALKQELQSAAAVIVFCREMAERATNEFAVPTSRVHQVPVGCDHWWRDLGGHLPDKLPRVLALGALRSARRTAQLIRAFDLYCQEGGTLDLHFGGTLEDKEAEVHAALEQSPNRKRIHVRKPDESSLPAYVASFKGLIHLAKAEGSPVTPLEAARLGLHLALERLPAFEEALDQISDTDPIWISANPNDREIVEALFQMERAGSRAPSACNGFTWNDSARAHIQVWQGLKDSLYGK